MASDRQRWADRRVLVTGGGGFLGSHVTELLCARGVAPERLIVPRSREIDLTDASKTRALISEARPDLIFHLAAKVGGIGANRRLPGTFFRDNMAMGLNVLEEARRAGVPKVVIAGTVCAYPKYTPVPFKEADLWNGYPEETNAPYGVAKKALLVMAQAYRAEFGSNFVMAFPTNLYGPRDNFDEASSHVIPAMIRKMVEAERSGAGEVTFWGDGSPTRDFLYAADAAEGLVAVAERYDEPEPINLGSGVEISMKELASIIQQETGFRGRIVWDTTMPGGQPRRMLDVSRAKEKLGFTAKTPFVAGLRETIAWYRANAS